MENKRLGLIGATSLVGQSVISILEESNWHVVAFSRQAKKSSVANIEWRCIDVLYPHPSPPPKGEEIIPVWICCAPIWVLPEYFNVLKASGVKRIVAVSSTSRFTKENSQDTSEQATAQKLVNAEICLQNWAEENGIEWIIIRPTLIYGLGKDKNIAEIIRLIKRWGFFPILGKGNGLRQPVHVEDVAKACELAISSQSAKNRAYNFTGGETLPYKEMVKRIFIATGKKPRLVHLPRWCFKLAILGLRYLPRFRNWSVTMADRMERDLVFDNKDAIADFGFHPRPFKLEKRDLP